MRAGGHRSRCCAAPKKAASPGRGRLWRTRGLWIKRVGVFSGARGSVVGVSPGSWPAAFDCETSSLVGRGRTADVSGERSDRLRFCLGWALRRWRFDLFEACARVTSRGANLDPVQGGDLPRKLPQGGPGACWCVLGGSGQRYSCSAGRGRASDVLGEGVVRRSGSLACGFC